MIKKEILDNTTLFDEKLPAQQDYDLWIRICSLCKVSYVSEPLVKYYNRRGKVQISSDISKYENAINILNKKYLNDIKKLDIDTQLNRNIESFLNIAKKGLRNNKPKVARKYLIYSLKQKITLKAISLYIMSFLKYEWTLRLQSLKTKSFKYKEN